MQGEIGRFRSYTCAAMTLVVKLGSSIVAADDGELRTDVLDAVCAQVSELERGGERVVMVTSGAIARGMRLLELPARPRAMDELQAASAVGQGDLFRAYEQRLAADGTRAAQVLLTAADIAARTNYLNARRTLRRLVEWGVVPVINENDTTATDEISFGDNDFLAAQVALLLDARLLVLLTNVDGVLTRRSGLRRRESLIERGRRLLRAGRPGDRRPHLRLRLRRHAQQGRGGRDGERGRHPGGDLQRHRAGDADRGRGRRRRRHPLRGQDGKASSFKLWLKYAKPTRGRILVDAGAARVLRERGSSLLPVGIAEVEGDFEAGDAVEVVARRRMVGKGIVDYSSRELSRVIGMKSAEVRERAAARRRRGDPPRPLRACV